MEARKIANVRRELLRSVCALFVASSCLKITTPIGVQAHPNVSLPLLAMPAQKLTRKKRFENVSEALSPCTRLQGKEVVLDSATGDFYAFDAKSDRWLAEGNVGILKTGAGLGGVAAAILADACGNVEGYGKERTVGIRQAFSSCFRVVIL